MVKRRDFRSNLIYGTSRIVGTTFESKRDEEPMDTKTYIAHTIVEYAEFLKENDVDGYMQVKFFDDRVKRYLSMTKFQKIEMFLSIDNVLQIIEDYSKSYSAKYGVNIQESFSKFTIMVARHKEDIEGFGKDKYNDCVYNCLIKVAEKETKPIFPTPESLKKFLNITRLAKITAEHFPLIEEKLKIRIRVVGEVSYTPSIKSVKEIVLMSYENHVVTIEEKECENYAKGIAVEGLPLAIFKYISNGKVLVYDGSKFTTKYTVDNIINMRRNVGNKDKAKFVLVECRYPDDNNIEKAMEETYYDFMLNAVTVDVLSDGKYDLLKCITPKKCVLNRFCEINNILKGDMIKQDEAEWLNACHKGGLIWAKTGYTGKSYKYDYISHYPSIMRQQKYTFPIKQGIPETLTNEEFHANFEKMKYFEYGIYRVIIEKYDCKLLKIKGNYATHYDLIRAKELGYKITLIEDGKHNVLSYAGANVRADGRIFKELIDELFELKKTYGDEIPLFKSMLNLLWGSLCERKKNYKNVKNDEVYTIPKTENLIDIDMYNGFCIVKTSEKISEFCTPFARLGPFLAARSRQILSHLIEEHYDDIVRVYVDGFLSKNPINFEHINKRQIENLGFGDDIGYIRYEGYNDHIVIKNASIIEGLKNFKV